MTEAIAEQLAVARAAGETAPLVVTIGYVNKANANIFSGQNTALAPQIYQGALDPNAGVQQRASNRLYCSDWMALAPWVNSRKVWNAS